MVKMVTLVTCAARKLQKNDGCTAISDHDVTYDAVSWFKIRKGDRRTVNMYCTNCVRLHQLLVPCYYLLSMHR